MSFTIEQAWLTSVEHNLNALLGQYGFIIKRINVNQRVTGNFDTVITFHLINKEKEWTGWEYCFKNLDEMQNLFYPSDLANLLVRCMIAECRLRWEGGRFNGVSQET